MVGMHAGEQGFATPRSRSQHRARGPGRGAQACAQLNTSVPPSLLCDTAIFPHSVLHDWLLLIPNLVFCFFPNCATPQLHTYFTDVMVVEYEGDMPGRYRLMHVAESVPGDPTGAVNLVLVLEYCDGGGRAGARGLPCSLLVAAQLLTPCTSILLRYACAVLLCAPAGNLRQAMERGVFFRRERLPSPAHLPAARAEAAGAGGAAAALAAAAELAPNFEVRGTLHGNGLYVLLCACSFGPVNSAPAALHWAGPRTLNPTLRTHSSSTSRCWRLRWPYGTCTRSGWRTAT